MPESPQNVQPSTFREFFDSLLNMHGLSGAQAARRLRVAESQIGRWRRGQGGISLENLERIHDEFGVDLDYLRQLAGLRNSSGSTTRGAVDAEREAWGAWYQHLIDSRVPRRMWEAYTRACEALADVFSGTPSTTLSADAGQSGDQHEDAPKPPLTSTSEPDPPGYPPARPGWSFSFPFAAGAD